MTARHDALSAVAVAAGHAWASWWRAELARQGRPMTGGWPGTLSEARYRVLVDAVAQLGMDRAPNDHELTDLARTAVATARADWLASAVPDPG